MHKVFKFMMVLQEIQTIFGYLQFLSCSLCFGQTKSDTLKSFSVTTNQDYPQQEHLSQNNSGKIYNSKLKEVMYYSVLLLGLVGVDCGISYQSLTGSTYWVFNHKLKGWKIPHIYRGCYVIFFLIFDYSISQWYPTASTLLVFGEAIFM